MKRFASILLAVVMVLTMIPVAIPASAAELYGMEDLNGAAYETMSSSQEMIDIIKDFEGFSATPYKDNTQWTVGYGSYCGDSSDPKPNITLTEDEAEVRLRKDLVKTYEPIVNDYCESIGKQPSQQQFDALISFTYNVGTGWMNSSALKTAMIQGAKGNEIIYAMSIWCTAGGSVLEGLIQRRLSEANLYLNGVYSKNYPSNYRYVIYDNNIEDAISTVKVQGYDANQTDTFRAAPSKAAYRFLGWYTEAKGGEWVTKLDHNTPKKLYAHWQSVNSGELDGYAASYVRYAGSGQKAYANPYGGQTKTLTAGTKLNIVADYMDNNGVKWGKISDSNWVKLNETKNAEETVQGQAVNVKVTVTANGVNIRKGPGTSYDAVGQYDKGDKIEILETKDGWARTEKGWVIMDYVKVN